MLVDAVTAFLAVASLLLVWAGVMKVVSPDPVTDVMTELGLPGRVWVARLLGCAEVVAGVWAAGFGGPVAFGTVGLIYLAFTVVVLRALVKGSPSCGCFGQVGAPPSWIHVIGNLFLGGVSLVSVGLDGSPADLVLGIARDNPFVAVLLVLAVGGLAGVFVVFFTAVPELMRARQEAMGGGEALRIETAPLGRFVGGSGRRS